MTLAPSIPETVVAVEWIFNNCFSLTTAPVLPEYIENLAFAFRACTKMNTYEGSTEELGYFVNYPIPQNVTSMNNTFCGCELMKEAPNLEKLTKLENMWSAFDSCISLETSPIIPNGVTIMNTTFNNCKVLKVAPVIPSSVKEMSATFEGCIALTTAPVIPSSVKNIQALFYNCESLNGNVEINSNPTDYASCFYGTVKPIKITGTCSIDIKKLISWEYTNVTY